jgi:hypothetical protein
MLSDGQKRSKDIAALAVELGCAQILVLRDHQIRRDSKDPEGVPGSYNHPMGWPVLSGGSTSRGSLHEFLTIQGELDVERNNGHDS